MENLSGLLPIVVIVAAFYFLFMRPNKARQRVAQQMREGIVPGVRVMTTSGIFGVVSAVDEESVHVEIAPGVIIEVLTAAVAKVIVPESAEAGSIGDNLQEDER